MGQSYLPIGSGEFQCYCHTSIWISVWVSDLFSLSKKSAWTEFIFEMSHLVDLSYNLYKLHNLPNSFQFIPLNFFGTFYPLSLLYLKNYFLNMLLFTLLASSQAAPKWQHSGSYAIGLSYFQILGWYGDSGHKWCWITYTDSKNKVSVVSAPCVPGSTGRHRAAGTRWQATQAICCSAMKEQNVNYIHAAL